MSLISDRLDKIEAAVDKAANRVTTDVMTLKTSIAELQAKVDAGGATPAELTRFDALVTRADEIDPATPSVIPAG